MPSINAKLRKGIFNGYGPLASFSARIDVAYALGIIDQSLFKLLHAVRELRNSLAHSPHLKSLDDTGRLRPFTTAQWSDDLVTFETKSIRRPQPAAFDTDLDDDVPF